MACLPREFSFAYPFRPSDVEFSQQVHQFGWEEAVKQRDAEEALRQMLDEYRMKYCDWLHRYLTRTAAVSYYCTPDPYEVQQIPSMKIQYRSWNLPHVSASFMEEGKLSMATMNVNTGTMSVWQEWNNLYYQVNSYATGSTTNLVETGTTAATIWQQWNSYYQQMTGMMALPVDNVRSRTQEQIDAERAEIARRHIEAVIAEAKKTEERKAAELKAKELLVSALEQEQKDSFELSGYFDVVVKGRSYRIRPGSMIELRNSKGIECRYCIHPDSTHMLPKEDVALSQKLLLESSEELFLRVANRHDSA